MRMVAILLLAGIAAPATAAERAPAEQVTPPAPHCARTTSYLADGKGLYRGTPLTPRKLTELPPASGYMAVYRQVDGCDAPLTMVEYRQGRRR
jgi:hypothetical protein